MHTYQYSVHDHFSWNGISIYILPSIMSLIFQKNVNYEMIRPEHWMALTQSCSVSFFSLCIFTYDSLSLYAIHMIVGYKEFAKVQQNLYMICRTGFTRYHSRNLDTILSTDRLFQPRFNLRHTEIFVKHTLQSETHTFSRAFAIWFSFRFLPNQMHKRRNEKPLKPKWQWHDNLLDHVLK